MLTTEQRNTFIFVYLIFYNFWDQLSGFCTVWYQK